MTIPVHRCPTCGANAFDPFERHQADGHDLSYVLCQGCGLVLQSPRMSDAELSAYYTSAYRRTVQGTEDATEKDLRVQAGRARHLVRFCRGRLPMVERHLDIGSSSGALIRAFARTYRCQGLGVEPGAAYRQLARDRGTETVGSLEEIDRSRSRSFDLVSLIHVLEHVPDPVAYLRDLRDHWMTPGGRLLVEVPNLFGHRATELSHLWVFDPGSLRNTLGQAGFRVIRGRTHGVPRSPLLRLYVTVLAEAVPAGVVAPRRTRWIRSRRRLGLWIYATLTDRLPNLTWQTWPEPEEADS